MAMLYQLGAVQFALRPVNITETTHKVGHDFAAKDIIGAPKPREAMGESDETMKLTAKLFPHRLGGMGDLAALKAMARAGDPQILMRGDYVNLGWFVIDSVEEKASYLDAHGVGRVIECDISLTRSPSAASASSMFSVLMSLFG